MSARREETLRVWLELVTATKTMNLKSGPTLRALSVLWSRMGSARVYVIAVAGLLVVLSAYGLLHLVSANAGRRAKLTSTDSASKTLGDRAMAARDPVVAISEVTPTERKARNGQTSVAVKIGVVPRPNTRKGEVEIRVFFFDVTVDGQMRPTQAQVDYKWTTPVRDWADPTPKYLVATYLDSGTSAKSAEGLRYGGFVVRVYCDGQLQDERSEPRELVAALRSGEQPTASPSTAVPNPANIAVSAPPPQANEASVENDVAQNAPARTSIARPSPPTTANREDSPPLPYASPVPDKPGFVYSPHDSKFLIDVRGVPPGTEVNDPNTGKRFRVP